MEIDNFILDNLYDPRIDGFIKIKNQYKKLVNLEIDDNDLDHMRVLSKTTLGSFRSKSRSKSPDIQNQNNNKNKGNKGASNSSSKNVNNINNINDSTFGGDKYGKNSQAKIKSKKGTSSSLPHSNNKSNNTITTEKSNKKTKNGISNTGKSTTPSKQNEKLTAKEELIGKINTQGEDSYLG